MNEAEQVLTELLHCSRPELYLNSRMPVKKAILKELTYIFKRRLQGEPVQYILGNQEFMGLRIKVDRRVFIPRWETEILVEIAYRYASCLKNPDILDIGTGSGCIAVALAKLLPNANISALDISHACLQVAEENARSFNLNINFIHADIKNFKAEKKWDIIVSNPPYIPTGQIAELDPQLQWEPRIALDGGDDGLRFFRIIFSKARELLAESGFLFLEIGYRQGDAIKSLIANYPELELKQIIQDYNTIDRILVAQLKAKGVINKRQGGYG